MKYIHKRLAIETYEFEDVEGLGMSEAYESWVDKTVNGMMEPIEIEPVDMPISLALAAPDLLEVCELLVKTLREQAILAFNCGGEIALNENNAKVAEKAREVIRKAKEGK